MIPILCHIQNTFIPIHTLPRGHEREREKAIDRERERESERACINVAVPTFSHFVLHCGT